MQPTEDGVPMDDLRPDAMSLATLADGELTRAYRVAAQTVLRLSLLSEADGERRAWLARAETSALALGVELMRRGRW